MSNFKKVIDFNKCFGIFVSDVPLHNIFSTNPDLVNLRLNLIKEEINELIQDGFNNKNFIEVIDALSDILYVVYGAGASFGIDLDESFKIYYNLKLWNNNSKTNFDMVKNYLKDSDNKILCNLFDNNELVQHIRLNHLESFLKEVNMLERYIKQKSLLKVENSLVKLLDYTYTLGCILGIDLNKSFEIVHLSNMSKLCINSSIAEESVEKYKNDDRYDTPNYRECYQKPGFYVVYNKSSGKILKSHQYTPADFKSMLPRN